MPREHLTTIEINGTYYGSQKPESFRKWARETPDDFVFAVKGPRFATNRRCWPRPARRRAVLRLAASLELGDKLGPVLWQFAPTKKFDADDFGAFLALLPREHDGRPLRHVVEVRHDSFFVPGIRRSAPQARRRRRLCRPRATIRRSPTSPATSSTRGCSGQDEIETGYPPQASRRLGRAVEGLGRGGEPD